MSNWLLADATFASPTFRKMDGATTAASTAMMAITTSSSRSVNPRRARREMTPLGALVLYDTEQFLDSSEASLTLRPAVLTQRRHLSRIGELAHLIASRSSRDGVA